MRVPPSSVVVDLEQIHYNRDSGTLYLFSLSQLTKTLLYSIFQIILPPPARKPKGKSTVENHVKYLETHLIERLKEKVFTSLEAINDETQKIIADINRREFQKKVGSRMDAYLRYDKPQMKPLPGDKYSTCDYKYILKVPDNYHLEYPSFL